MFEISTNAILNILFIILINSFFASLISVIIYTLGEKEIITYRLAGRMVIITWILASVIAFLPIIGVISVVTV